MGDSRTYDHVCALRRHLDRRHDRGLIPVRSRIPRPRRDAQVAAIMIRIFMGFTSMSLSA
jgi:hypothetical protein